MTNKVTFTASLIDDDADYADKQSKACDLLNVVWNSDEFKNAVLNNSHTATTGILWWKKTQEVFAFTSTLFSNEGVYEKLMSNPNPHVEQDIVYCANPRVVGYEYNDDPTTYVCKGWDESLDVYGVVENIAHEYCHTLGFVHSSAKDLESVPYKIGKIAGGLARKLSQSNSALENQEEQNGKTIAERV